MRRPSFTQRTGLAIVFSLIVSLAVAAGGAQAVVVNVGAAGRVGIALVPGTRSQLGPASVQPVTSNAPCVDPALPSDLTLPGIGLCSHGGTVMHRNETFAFTWDPRRWYWQTTRDYIEQFLRDVADGSGSLTSPYAVATQYSDAGGHAANSSLYGGGCIDYGNPGGYTCQFGNTNGSGAGNNYPGCTTGSSCVITDQQIQDELRTMIPETGVLSHTVHGYAPLVVLLTPPNVQVCMTASLCSANAPAIAQFCSYHSHLVVGGSDVAYLVQPWTAFTGCDEPKLPPIPNPATARQLAIAMGLRIVNPLSQAQIAAVVNPFLNGWFANDGSEINDNGPAINQSDDIGGCQPFGPDYDTVTVGQSSQNPYVLQREFNNAGIIETDPNAPACAPLVELAPTFVAPSSVNRGDAIEFDGSTTTSTLIVPRANFVWSFGDGSSARGPSVVHSYASKGTYSVQLTVTDRGGNVRSLSETIEVLGPTTSPTPGLHARLQLVPEGLRGMLRHGVAMLLTSNQPADGVVIVSIPRRAARHAHLAGRGAAVVIGRGTVSGIHSGTMHLHLRLSRAVAAKLAKLGHVTLTVKVLLITAGGGRLTIDAAGRY